MNPMRTAISPDTRKLWIGPQLRFQSASPPLIGDARVPRAATTAAITNALDCEAEAGQQLGRHDPRSPRLERERRQPRALGPLAGDQQDHEDGQEVAEDPAGQAELIST